MIAGESRYSAEAEEVAEILDNVEGLVNEDGESVAEVADYLRERRRELFPEGPGETADAESTDNATNEVSSE